MMNPAIPAAKSGLLSVCRRISFVFALMTFLVLPVAGTFLPGMWAAAQETGDQEKEQPADPPVETGAQESTDAASDQEGKTEAETQPAADQPEGLEGLLARWSALEMELVELETQINTSANAETARQARASYVEKNNEAINLVNEIEKAAVDKLAQGQPDQALFETLTGLTINHAAFERDKEALELGQKLIAAGIEPRYFEAAAQAERLQPAPRDVLRELAIRAREATADDLPRVKLVTGKGDIVIELFENEAPDTVGNFINLVESGFYDGLTFHRVIDGLMAQAGDPKGDGTGGPGYNIYCECYKSDFRRHFPFVVGMEHNGARDTGGSRFYITLARLTNLDGRHTVFGRVIEGQEVVGELEPIDPSDESGVTAEKIVRIEVLRKRDHAYEPVKVGE